MSHLINDIARLDQSDGTQHALVCYSKRVADGSEAARDNLIFKTALHHRPARLPCSRSLLKVPVRCLRAPGWAVHVKVGTMECKVPWEVKMESLFCSLISTGHHAELCLHRVASIDASALIVLLLVCPETKARFHLPQVEGAWE